MTTRELVFFIVGALSTMAMLLYLAPRPGAEMETLPKEQTAYLVKAHVQCFETELAKWALRDSIYVPIDSIEKEYARICGTKIDSIMQ